MAAPLALLLLSVLVDSFVFQPICKKSRLTPPPSSTPGGLQIVRLTCLGIRHENLTTAKLSGSYGREAGRAARDFDHVVLERRRPSERLHGIAHPGSGQHQDRARHAPPRRHEWVTEAPPFSK